MRKFTLLLAMVALVSFAFGQKGFLPVAKQLTKAETVTSAVKADVTQQTKAPGDVIWEHDFRGDLWSGTSYDGLPVPANAPDGWELTDATGNGFFWRWSMVGPRGNFTSPGDDCHEPFRTLNSTTGYNGFLMLESNYYNTPADCSGILQEPMDGAVVYTAGIDFSGATAVHLMFTQWNRFCCSYSATSDAWFETSTDGGDTWEKKSVSLAAVNAGTVNGANEIVDITTMVAGHANVQFRFRQQGLTHYHWELDDVKFVEPVAFDMAITDYWNDYIQVYTGAEENDSYLHENDFIEGYYAYPWFMIQSFEAYAAEYNNLGSSTVTNYKQGVQIRKNNVTVATFESAVVASIEAGSIDTTKAIGSYMPDGKGSYEILHYPILAEVDGKTSNDTLARPFTVTDTMLSPVKHREFTSTASPDNWTSYEVGGGLGFSFDIPETSLHGDGTGDYYKVKGIEVYVPRQRAADEIALFANEEAAFVAELYVYDVDADAYTLVINSETRVLTLADTATMVYIPFNYDGTAEVITTAGDYLVNLVFIGNWYDQYDRIQSFNIGTNGQHKVSVGAANIVPPGAVGVGWVNDGFCMALAMNFGDTYAATEHAVTFAVTDGTNPIENARVMVGANDVRTDVAGQAIAHLENGTYPVTVTALGYSDYVSEITVAADGTVEVVLGEEFAIKFVVSDDLGIIGLAEIAIEGVEDTERTNVLGEATFNLVAGTYNYTVTKIGHDDLTGSVVVSANATESAVMVRTNYNVTFTVTDGTNAIAGATVDANGTQVDTDASGEAVLQLPFGINEFTVTKDTYTTYTGAVTAIDGATASAEIYPTFDVTFTVTDGTDALADATVTINGATLTTNASGQAVIALGAGEYPYIATKEGYGVDEGIVTVVDAPVAVDVELIVSYAVTFTVVDDGSPIAGAIIAVNGGQYTTSVVGQSIVLLPDGDHIFTVEAAGYPLYEGTVTVAGEAVSLVVDLIGISDVFATFSVYPNPSNGAFTVSVDGMANMTVLDITGQIVDSRVINGTETINLDVVSGVYFVRVQTGNEIATKQVVIR